MSVVRYNFVNDYHYCGCGEVEDDNGEYVEYADYQKLLDENAQLRAAIERDAARQDTELLDRLDLSICSVRPYDPWRAESEEEARWHVHNPAIKGRKAAGFNAMTVREAIARALDAEAA